MKKILLTLALQLSCLVFGQAPTIQWQTCLGGSSADGAKIIQQTTDGGYILLGSKSGVSGWLVKLTSLGTPEWETFILTTGSNTFNSVKQTSDGGYIVACSSFIAGVSENYRIIKLDNLGGIEWQKSLGGTNHEIAYDIQQTTDGGYIVAGSSDSNDGNVSGNHGLNDCWIVKLNSSGTTVWQKSLGGTANDAAYSIAQTADGGFIVAGNTYSNDGDVSGNHGDFDLWTVKLDASGSVVWQACLGGSNTETAYSVTQATDGGFVVAGRTNSNDGDVSGNHGDSDYWIVKLSDAGAILWQKCLGGTGSDWAYRVLQAVDGDYVVGGMSYSNDGDVSGNHGDTDYWIVKLDDPGTIVWQKCLGGTGNDSAYSMEQTMDGGFVIAGDTYSNNGDVSGNNGSKDAWVVKLNPEVGPAPPPGASPQTFCAPATVSDLVATGDNLKWYSVATNGSPLSPSTPLFSNLYYVSQTIDGVESDRVSVMVTVNQVVSPTFNAVDPICGGGLLAPLPTNSNNGVSGTWSPALNNLMTTTYAFTPDAGQCATTTTLTVVVVSIIPTFTPIEPICAGTPLNPLPTVSNNGFSGVWSPPTVNNQETTLYVFTPVGDCAVQTALTIVVNPQTTPTFAAVAPICEGAALPALPAASLDGITGTWSPAPNNTATTTYTFTPTAGQCASPTTLTITVNTVNATTSLDGVTITANLAGASYQWVNCNDSSLPIPNQTNQSFTPTANGQYAVIVTADGCSSMSDCVAITTLDIDKIETTTTLSIYPNPAGAVLNIKSDKAVKSVTVVDMNGRQIKIYPVGSNVLDISSLADGIYFLEIKTETGYYHKRFIKQPER